MSTGVNADGSVDEPVEAALGESTEQFERGEFEDAGVLAVRLAARL